MENTSPSQIEAIARMSREPLTVDIRGSSVRVVTGSNYTVANISQGMNDRVAYARLFAAAPDLLALAEMFEKTVAYYAGIDRKNGDDEGARLKTLTLYGIKETIAMAKGELN